MNVISVSLYQRFPVLYVVYKVKCDTCFLPFQRGLCYFLMNSIISSFSSILSFLRILVFRW